ncbi:MAG: hypothetical protein K6G52_07020 [Treponemataceae bacterium]|nr:hypothetical protein [Treponemataceae bacterium]
MKFYTKLLCAAFISIVVLSFFTGISCTLNPQGIQILNGDYTSPKLISFDLLSENSATVCFSRSIILDEIQVENLTSENNVSLEATDLGNGSWQIDFTENLDCSNFYALEGNVKDEHGNSLYFKNKFQGYNSRIPELRLNEIRTELSKPKCEFIELEILSDGNLGGMQIITASDGEEKAVILPNAEVKQGEFVVIHMRKLEDDCTNELDEDTLLSGGTDSGSHRDLWIENTSARIGKSDVIIVKDRLDGNIVDAIVFRESSCLNWKNDYVKNCAQQVFQSGIWDGTDEESAVCSDGLTTTRTLCRQNDGHSKNSWIVVATGKCSPGKTNSSEAYVAK